MRRPVQVALPTKYMELGRTEKLAQSPANGGLTQRVAFWLAGVVPMAILSPETFRNSGNILMLMSTAPTLRKAGRESNGVRAFCS